jgi:hypothetical protein
MFHFGPLFACFLLAVSKTVKAFSHFSIFHHHHNMQTSAAATFVEKSDDGANENLSSFRITAEPISPCGNMAF